MDARNFIDLLGAQQSAEAKDALEELLASTAMDALDAKKKEIASTLFNGKSDESEESVEVEDQQPEVQDAE